MMTAGERSRTLLPRTLMLIAMAGLLLGLACNDADSDTPEATSTPSVDPAAIRDADLRSAPEVQSALARLGSATIAEQEVLFGDVTGDGVEEAIIPFTSGGTMGNVMYLVYTMDGTQPAVALTRNLDASSPSGIRMDIEDGVLVEYIGEFGPSDPFCCPSLLRRTTFEWDGAKLVEADVERIPGGQKE